MNSGYLRHYDEIHWKLELEATSDRSAVGTALGNVDAVQAIAGLSTTYEISSALPPTTGIILAITATDCGDESGTHLSDFANTQTVVTLEIPDWQPAPIAASFTVSSSFESNVKAELVFEDVDLYQSGGSYLLSIGILRWIINDSEEATYTPSDSFTGLLTPAGVPLFGLGPILAANAPTETAAPAETFEDCDFSPGDFVDGVYLDTIHPGSGMTRPTLYDPFQKIADVSSTATGGWRVNIDSAYYNFPVTVDLLSLPETNCGPEYEEPTASNTFNGATSAHTRTHREYETITLDWEDDGGSCEDTHAHYEVLRDITRFDSHASQVMLMPDQTKGVLRLVEDGYAALIQAGGFPQTTATASTGCCKKTRETDACGTVTDDSDSDLVTSVIHAAQDGGLFRITDTTHASEAVFAATAYAPASATGKRVYQNFLILRQHGPIPGPCTTPACYPEGASMEKADVASYFPANVTPNGDEWEYLTNSDMTTLYGNTVCHPGWSFFYYFPDDEDEDFWKCQGSKVNSGEYWIPIGEQWFNAADIAEGDDVATRNFLLSAPLVDEGVLSSVVSDAAMNVPTSWWGVSRWYADIAEPPASVALDSSSSSRWSATGAALTHGGSITVNPSTVNCSVAFNLSSIGVTPYMYPMLADRIAVNWSATNVNSMTVKLVTPDGSEVTLATTPGTYPRPAEVEAKFAGSWARDYSAGSSVSDTGADTHADGISSAVMGDAERSVAYQLINAYSEYRLVYEIVVDDVDVDVTINYPTFYVSESDAYIVAENRQITDIVFPDGPGLRIGGWKCDDDMGNLTDPSIREWELDGGLSKVKMTAVDYLVIRNLVYFGQAKSTNLTSDLASLYTSAEGQSVGDAAQDTIVTIIPGGKVGTAMLINGQREIPPLQCWPYEERDVDYGLVTGTLTFDNRSYSHTQEPRYIIAGAGILNIYQPSPRLAWSSISALSIAGWNVTEHSHAVTNDEIANFPIACDELDIAVATPWHGYLATACAAQQVTADLICLIRDYTDRLFLFYRNPDGNLAVLAYTNDELSYVVYIVDDGSDNCTHPSYHLLEDLLIGTHLRVDVPVLAMSYYHGINDGGSKVWDIQAIDNALSYESLTSCHYIDRMVIAGYSSDTWHVQVGLLQQNGLFSWSDPVAIATLTDPSNFGLLGCRQDAVLEFGYLETDGTPHISYCYSLDYQANGDWVDINVDNALPYDVFTFDHMVDRMVVLGYSSGWYVQVGLLQQDGTYVWSDPVAIATLTDPSAYGDLTTSEFGVLEFGYLETDGTPHVARCYAIDADAVGDWIDS